MLDGPRARDRGAEPDASRVLRPPGGEVPSRSMAVLGARTVARPACTLKARRGLHAPNHQSANFSRRSSAVYRPRRR